MSDQFPSDERLLAWAADSGYTKRDDGWYDEDGQGPYVLLDQWFAAMEDSQDLDYILGTGPLEGARQIQIERTRQKMVEGWTAEHDDGHVHGDLAAAAVSYIVISDPDGAGDTGFAEEVWPWEPEGFKPSEDPIENLVRAGALIAAEIDRLQRAQG